jgi:hypothetical protein
MSYDRLLKEVELNVHEVDMPNSVKGLYSDKVIWINKRLRTSIEKKCILAEELGHHHTSSGDILDQSNLHNRKQEYRARNWAYEKLVPLTSFIHAHKTGIKSKHELADHLEVTEKFLEDSIKYYKDKYGIFKTIDTFTICFEPLRVIEIFED